MRDTYVLFTNPVMHIILCFLCYAICVRLTTSTYSMNIGCLHVVITLLSRKCNSIHVTIVSIHVCIHSTLTRETFISPYRISYGNRDSYVHTGTCIFSVYISHDR